MCLLTSKNALYAWKYENESICKLWMSNTLFLIFTVFNWGSVMTNMISPTVPTGCWCTKTHVTSDTNPTHLVIFVIKPAALDAPCLIVPPILYSLGSCARVYHISHTPQDILSMKLTPNSFSHWGFIFWMDKVPTLSVTTNPRQF